MPTGLPGQTRLPEDSQRARRNAGKLATAFSAYFGNGFVINPDGTVAVLGQAPIFVDSSGVGLNFSTGLQLSGSNLVTKDPEIVHDDLSGFVGNEHIDWTDAAFNFKTIGTGTFDIDGDALIIGNDQDYDIGYDNAGVYGYFQLNTASSFFRIPNATGNYTQWAKVDGFMTYVGNAQPFDDLRVAALATKVPAAAGPGFAQFKDDGSGSTGVFLYWFDDTSEEQVYFEAQMPHRWVEGGTIYPHVHWTPAVNGNPGEQVRWGLEYTIADPTEDYGNTTLIGGSTSIPDETPVADRHYKTRLGAGIDMTGFTISSVIICRLFRDVGHGDDDYGDDAGLVSVDFHYRADTEGSRQEFIK